MSKARILQIIALILIVMGGYILYTRIVSDAPVPTMLAGIGPIIMGFALILISLSKAVNQGKKS